MRSLRYSINITLDGCCDHNSVIPDEELQRRAAETIARADALIFGRVIYEMMESAFRSSTQNKALPESVVPFARTIDLAKKYVVSSTLHHVDWNAELIRGSLKAEILKLKHAPGKELYVGGVKLPMALAELGLIDEYEFVVHPRIVGYGPKLFEGLKKPLDLRLIDRKELKSGAVAFTYEPKILA